MSETIERIRDYPGCDGHSIQTFLNEDDTYSGYCYALGKYIHDPYKDKPDDYVPKKQKKTFAEVKAELDEIQSIVPVGYPERHIEQEVMEYFDVKVGVSEVDGESPSTLHFPYYAKEELTGYKNKLISAKQFWATGNVKDAEPFGWSQALQSGAPKVFITEGELDAMALYQMLKTHAKGGKWEDLDPAVISLKDGAGSAKAFLAKWQPQLHQHFRDIVFVFDTDEPGIRAAHQGKLVIEDALVAELPLKDANECLMNGRSKGAVSAVLFKADKVKNTRIIKGSALSLAAKTPAVMGLSWPWEKFTKLTKGIRRKEMVVVGAGAGMGKSILLSAMAGWTLSEHGLPVFIAKPEEASVKTYQELVAQVAERRFNDPDIPFDYEAYDLADAEIKDRVNIIDSYQFLDFDTLVGDIKYAAVADKVRDFYIDPLTCLVNDMTSSEANEHLNNSMALLAAMAKDLDLTFYLYSHLNNPKTGPAHEEGGAVHINQLTNSRGMMRTAQTIIGLEGDNSPDLEPNEQNFRDLVLLKDREYGGSGKVNLKWSDRTGKFREVGG